MTFESFIKGDISPFQEEESLEDVKSKLGNCIVYNINEEDQAYAIHAQGAEFLFDLNQLCLIQYEFGQLNKFIFENNTINKDTSYNDFKKYLIQSKILFKEKHKNQQKILETSDNIKIFFDEINNKFLSAMKSW